MMLNPDYLMSTIKIADNTPKHIRWLVRMLKGMQMWNNLELIKDREKMIKFFTTWFNTNSPQHILWGSEITEATVADLYNQSVSWIMGMENV